MMAVSPYSSCAPQSWHCMDTSVAGLRELLDVVSDENPPDDFRHAFVIGDDTESGRVVAATLAAPPFSSRLSRRVAWLEGATASTSVDMQRARVAHPR